MNEEETLKLIEMTINKSNKEYISLKEQFEELLNDYIELARSEEQLQNNWNELKKFNEEKLKQYQKQLANADTDLADRVNYTRCYCHRDNLDKMEELEGNNE